MSVEKIFIRYAACLIPRKNWRKRFRGYFWDKPYRLNRFPFYAANKRRIAKLKNQYKGKRCFIIGGAPSLDKLDLSKLAGEYTFTVGRGYRLKEKGLAVSTFHVLSDVAGYEEFKNEIDDEFSDLYFVSTKLDYRNPKRDSVYFAVRYYPDMKNGYFQSDLNKPLSRGHTVVAFALQIAVFFGFSEIVFIGVDLDFTAQSGHAYGSSSEEVERQESISVQQEKKMLRALTCAADLLEQKGIRLVNASPAGRLDCMPRVVYDDLFPKS